MRLQNWLVFSECIPKTEIIFPVRLGKNRNAKCEQLWRDEQLQLFWSCFACIGGMLKSACGCELKLGSSVAGELGTHTAQNISSAVPIKYSFWPG